MARSKYWNTMVDILEAQFPKKQCKERGRALVMLSYIEMMLQGVEFGAGGLPLKEKWTLSKQNNRDMHDPGFVEAICKHGVGHHKGVHGCDGCCARCPKDIWKQVTKE